MALPSFDGLIQSKYGMIGTPRHHCYNFAVERSYVCTSIFVDFMEFWRRIVNIEAVLIEIPNHQATIHLIDYALLMGMRLYTAIDQDRSV